MTKKRNTNIPRKSLVNWKQLELFPLQVKKPQVSSIPGVSPKERRRYQVKIGDRIIASHLDIDDALAISAEVSPAGGMDS
jgi:hypothetical protein